MSGTSFLCRLRASVRSFPLPTPLPRTKACGWLSQPLSTMPDKTPRGHIAALRRPTWIATGFLRVRLQSKSVSGFLRPCLNNCMPCRGPDHGRSLSGLPEFYDVSLSACHGLMTPPDLHILAKTDASVLPSVHVKTLGVRN